MKRLKFLFVFALCAILSLSTLVGCSKDYETADVKYSGSNVQVSASRSDEDRLKPLAVTFGVFSCFGTVILVVAFAISKKKERENAPKTMG